MMLQRANAGQRLAVVFVTLQMELQASIAFILKVLLFYGERKKGKGSIFLIWSKSLQTIMTEIPLFISQERLQRIFGQSSVRT